MKILILATDIYSASGIARYSWTLASALGELAGADNVHLLALLDSGHLHTCPKGFCLLDAVAPRLTRAAQWRFAAKALQQARKGYDLAICTHVAVAPISAAIRRLHGTAYWVACHDAEVWEPLPAAKRAGLRRAQLALPVSQYTAERLREVQGIPREKIRVLHNAIPDEFAALLLAGSGNRNTAAGLAKDERYILSVGSLARAHAYKGFDTVLRALPRLRRELPHLRYVIVGTGDDRPRLERLASECGVREITVFAGWVSDRELADYYQGCDAFVMPSRAGRESGRWHGEGFGRVYIEAALAGKPVVGSTGGGAAEAVLHGKTGLLVDPASVPEVEDALLVLLRNGDLAAGMGREGRLWASRSFTQTALRAELAETLGVAVRSEVSG